MNKQVRQYELRSGSHTFVTFLDDLNLAVGSKITLKDGNDPDRLWEVVASFAVADEKDLHNQNAADNWNKHNNI